MHLVCFWPWLMMITTLTTDTLETPTLTTCTDTFLNKSDYRDEYYADDEYSRDPDVDYTDTICYQPGLSTRRSRASGAFHHGISPQPWQCQPNNSSGKSLTKQDQQNRRYPKPRKARKRHKKKRLKPTGALCTQIKETQQLPDHPPIPLTMESAHEHKKRHNQGSPPTPKKAERAQPPHYGELLPLVCRTRMSHAQPRLLMVTKCHESS
jgi:hypothetical protein